MATTYFNPNQDRVFNIAGQHVPDYVQMFLFYEASMNRLSPLSVRSYCLTVQLFLRWLACRGDENQLIDEADVSSLPIGMIQYLSPSDISDFLDYCCVKRSNSASALSSKLSALNSFFDYCVRFTDDVKTNPASAVSAPKVIKKPVRFMTGREALSLIHACDQGQTPARDVCIATFMLNCGLRLSEVVALNITDIEGDVVRIRGKGRKDRWLSLNDDCMSALKFWKDERDMYSLTDYALFVSRRYNRRLTERSVELMLDKAIKRAGLRERGYSAHSLRLAAGNLMFQSGKFDVADLQSILGHKCPSFAEKYARMDGNRIRDTMKEYRIKE